MFAVFGLVLSCAAYAADPAPAAATKAAPAAVEAPKAPAAPSAPAEAVKTPTTPGQEVVLDKKKTAAQEADRPYGKQNQLIPFVQFGPKLNLLVLPALGLEVRAFNYVSASFDYLYVPNVSIGTNAIGMNAWWAGLRVHPMGGSFFLGADLYNIRAAATRSETFQITSPVTASTVRDFTGTADLLGVTPMLGWRWVTASGFFTGLELGANITFSSSLLATQASRDTNTGTTVTLPDGTTQSLDSVLNDRLNSVNTAAQPFSDYPKRYLFPHIRFLIGFVF